MSKDDLGKDIGEFLDSAPKDPEPDPQEPVVEPTEPAEPVTEPVEPTEPKEPSEPAEPKEPQESGEPAISPDVPPADAGKLTEREKAMLDRIEKLTGEQLSVEDATAPQDTPAVKDPDATPLATPKDEFKGFLAEGESLDDILDSPEKFNSVLMRVYEKGVADAQQKSVEKVLKSIPQLVTQYVGRHATMTNMVSDFYKANQDLVGVKKTVAAVANEVAAENPGMTVDKVFEETAIRTRKVLGLQAKAVSKVVDKVPAGPAPVDGKPSPDPAFVDQGGRKAPVSSGLKGLTKEVNDLIT